MICNLYNAGGVCITIS